MCIPHDQYRCITRVLPSRSPLLALGMSLQAHQQLQQRQYLQQRLKRTRRRAAGQRLARLKQAQAPGYPAVPTAWSSPLQRCCMHAKVRLLSFRPIILNPECSPACPESALMMRACSARRTQPTERLCLCLV